MSRYRSSDTGGWSSAIAGLLIVAVAVLIIVLCRPKTELRDVTEALEEAGYSQIVIGEPDGWHCGRGDAYGRKWTATAINGSRVRGVVCFGPMKGMTIRRLGRA